MIQSIKFFFACSYPLEEGSIVLPGNWGRIVKMYTTTGFGNAWIQYREDIFEKVRQEHFSEKPSRLDSIFLCETAEDLRIFLDSAKRPLDMVYEVELADTDLTIHKGCLRHLDFGQQENYKTFETKAFYYWKAKSIERAEIVTTSRVRILNVL